MYIHSTVYDGQLIRFKHIIKVCQHAIKCGQHSSYAGGQGYKDSPLCKVYGIFLFHEKTAKFVRCSACISVFISFSEHERSIYYIYYNPTSFCCSSPPINQNGGPMGKYFETDAWPLWAEPINCR